MMTIGMLWFDNSSRSLEEKVIAAARYYRTKYEVAADICYVNSAQFNPAEGLKVGYIEIVGAKTVLPNHFWIGRGEVEQKCEIIGSAI